MCARKYKYRTSQAKMGFKREVDCQWSWLHDMQDGNNDSH
jgi:hypothetical protein